MEKKITYKVNGVSYSYSVWNGPEEVAEPTTFCTSLGSAGGPGVLNLFADPGSAGASTQPFYILRDSIASPCGADGKPTEGATIYSKTINDMVGEWGNEDLRSGEEGQPIAVPLTKVSSDVLPFIIQFLEHNREKPMKEIPQPISNADMIVNAGAWYGAFINFSDTKIVKENKPEGGEKELKLLYALINAANFLCITPLLQLACCKIATTLYGKKRTEIPEMFGLPADYVVTEEQKARVLENYPWVREVRDKLEARMHLAANPPSDDVAIENSTA